MSKKDKIEKVIEFENGSFLVRENKKYGIIDKDGNIVLNIKYAKIIKHSDLFIVYRKEKCRIKDINGNNISKNKYDEIKDTNSSLFIVRNGEYFGLIDFKGNEVLKSCYKVIRPIYYDCADFFIVTNKEGKCGLVDKNGNVLLKCKYFAIYKLHHDRFSVLNNDGYSIYSIYKGFLTDFKIEKIPTFLSYSLNIIVMINGKFGIMDLDGKVVTECKYDAMYHCSRYADELSAKIGDKYCLINNKGLQVTQVKFDYIKYLDVEKGILIVREETKFGVIKNDGREIITPSFDALKMLGREYILTRYYDYYSLFDINGKVINNYFKKEDFKDVCMKNNITYDIEVIDIMN